MISFVWEPGIRLPAGTGGMENYTTGHVRELTARGIGAQVVTIGLGEADGREEFPDVPFLSLDFPNEVTSLDGVLVFVGRFPSVTTRARPYQLLHIPPPLHEPKRSWFRDQLAGRIPIATSRYAQKLWADFLSVDRDAIAVVYPFAERAFALAVRPPSTPEVSRILYAGRLSPEKGIYTLLAAMHSELIVADRSLVFAATTAGDDKPQGAIIRGLLEAHPGMEVIAARANPAEMAALFAGQDIVVMPSNGQYWHETFGIVSVEAQHAGCRVVASDDGGLPETDCGSLIVVAPNDANALALGIQRAVAAGPVSEAERRRASAMFSLDASVGSLIAVLAAEAPPTTFIRPDGIRQRRADQITPALDSGPYPR